MENSFQTASNHLPNSQVLNLYMGGKNHCTFLAYHKYFFAISHLLRKSESTANVEKNAFWLLRRLYSSVR